MGSTPMWDASVYDRVTGAARAAGTAFSYTRYIKSGLAERKAHDLLNVIKDGKPTVREARDSKNHPNTTPIIIGFDVTGSMGENPELLQGNLKQLFGLLQRKAYVEDPAIAIGAYGDAYCDHVPIQFGQFEAGNEIDEELDHVYIEGCGGGNNGETSTLLAKYAIDHTVTDAWEKRRKRGYLFLIGDERALDLRADQLREFLAEEQPASETAESVYKRVQEKWNTYFLLIDNWAARRQRSYEQYSGFLGKEHVIRIDSGNAAAATIASILGACEQTADADTVGADLTEAGFDEHTALAVVNATKDLYAPAGATGREPVSVDDAYGELAL